MAIFLACLISKAFSVGVSKASNALAFTSFHKATSFAHARVTEAFKEAYLACMAFVTVVLATFIRSIVIFVWDQSWVAAIMQGSSLFVIAFA